MNIHIHVYLFTTHSFLLTLQQLIFWGVIFNLIGIIIHSQFRRGAGRGSEAVARSASGTKVIHPMNLYDSSQLMVFLHVDKKLNL